MKASLLAVGALFGLFASGSIEVAKVNNRVITLDDLNQRYQENTQLFRFKPLTKQGVLDDMIKRELGLQEALRIGLDKDPKVRDRIDTMLYTAYVERVLAEKFRNIKISNSDLESYYKKNPTVRTSHILIKVSRLAPADQQKAAEDKIRKIYEIVKTSKKSFPELAKQYSEGPSAPIGGDVDFHTKDELDPAFYNTALKLNKGDVSAPVRSQFGWHIIKLTDVRGFKEADIQKYNALVFDEKRAQIFDDFFADLKKKNKITVNESALK